MQSMGWGRYKKGIKPEIKKARSKVLQAFKELRKEHGFVCRANFWCCSTCACSAFEQMLDKNKKNEKPKKIRGFVYWHKQDEEFLHDGSDHISIRFTDTESKDIESELSQLEVGIIVQHVLQKHGLIVEWEGVPEKVIEVKGIIENETKELVAS